MLKLKYECVEKVPIMTEIDGAVGINTVVSYIVLESFLDGA
jgi:hypothetical protein